MNPDFAAFLAARGAVIDNQRILDPAQRFDRETRYVVPLVHVSRIRASGEEAADFLQNLLTNEVRKLAPGAAEFNGFCSPKGRLLASFLMWRDGADFLMQASADIAPGVQKKLSMYVLRSKVKLSADDRVALGLVGPSALEVLARRGALPEGPLAVKEHEGLSVIRLSGARAQVLAAPALAQSLYLEAIDAGCQPGATAIWDACDILEGVPLITAATQEEFVPQMVNFEVLGGVSFKKGCYPGQEIVARTQYLGKLKKRMFRARLPRAARAGEPLYGEDLADQACGSVLACAPVGDAFEVLAVVQLSSHEAGPVRLGDKSGPVLEWLPLPYALPA